MLEALRFLEAHPPFSSLDPEQLDQVARTVEMKRFPAGTVVLEEGGQAASHLFVLRDGVVELIEHGQVVELLDGGDLFGFSSLLSGSPPMFTVRVRKDALCYTMTLEEATRVFSEPSGIRFLTTTLRHRASLSRRSLGDMTTVGDLQLGPLVTVSPITPIRQVATDLTEAGVRAAVVESSEGLGIITDRDIRAKVVAGDIGRDAPVSVIATPEARTTSPDEMVDVAIARMLRLGVHHLPVVEHDRVTGMVTDLDLLVPSRQEPFRLRTEIERASDVDRLTEAGRRIPAALVPLIDAGVDAEHIGVIAAALTDALTSRMLELARAALGPAPTEFAWIALGSTGRRDQGLAPDQDHALVFAGDSDQPDGWFLEMARFVTDGIERAGFPRCPSKMMAGEDGWRGSEAWWRARIGQWMEVAERKAAFLTASAFDGRVVYGTLDVDPLFRLAVDRASGNPLFLRRLERLVGEIALPVGLFGQLQTTEQGDQQVIDVKRGGIQPINDLARIVALRAGVRAVGTVRRLREAAGGGEIDRDVAEGLEEALALLRDVRNRHQAAQWAKGHPIDDLVAPDALGALERRAVRDAFRLVRDVRRHLAGDVQPRLLGR